MSQSGSDKMADHMRFWAGNLPKQNRLLSKPAVGKIVYFLLIYFILDHWSAEHHQGVQRFHGTSWHVIWYFSGTSCLLQWSAHGVFTSMTVKHRESLDQKYLNFTSFRVWLLKAWLKLEQQEGGVGHQFLAPPLHHHQYLFEFIRVQMSISTKSPIGLSRRKIAVDVLCARTSKLKCSVKNVQFLSASTKKEIASKTTTMSSVSSSL